MLDSFRILGGSCGNSNSAVFTSGYNGSSSIKITEVYSFSFATRKNGTSLALAKNSFASAGDSTMGLFCGGNTSSGATGLSEKYILLNDVVVPATSLTLPKFHNTAITSSPGGF